MSRMTILVLATLVALATAAGAADPECEDPALAFDPAAGLYVATPRVRFCTPGVDVDGEVLLEGDLVGCTVSVGDEEFPVPAATDPLRLVEWPIPESVTEGTRFDRLEVYCATAAGPGARAVAPVAVFRGPGPPGVPALLN